MKVFPRLILKALRNIYQSPAEDSVGVFSMLQPDKSMLVVRGFFVELLLSEMHIISSFWLIRLRKFLKSLMWDEIEEIFKWIIDKSFCTIIFIFLNSGMS